MISDLHRTELLRAAQRVGSGAVARSQRLLSELELLTLTGAEFDAAGLMPPTQLRSSDALHLAAAQALGRDLAGVVAYDRRLLDAAESAGVAVASPS